MFRKGDIIRFKLSYLKTCNHDKTSVYYNKGVVNRVKGLEFDVILDHGEVLIKRMDFGNFDLIKPAGPLTEMDILDNIQRNIQEDL